jgi:3,4-dihydroxy-2-butanone 4-phosphate synthase
MFDPIEDIIEEAKLGRPFIITDDEDRENEGDIIIPAQYITVEIINLMIMFARGLICVSIDQNIADKFDLKLHPRRNVDEFETAFAYSIDSKAGVATGMSATDKVHTIQRLISENSTINDFKVPGHIFPVIAREKGVLERRGHTEAAIDIAKLAKLKPAMVICEIINDDGTMARRNDLLKFSKKHGMKISSVEKLVQYIK